MRNNINYNDRRATAITQKQGGNVRTIEKVAPYKVGNNCNAAWFKMF